MEPSTTNGNLKHLLQQKCEADNNVSTAREFDEQSKFSEALELYSKSTSAYVSLLESFMQQESLTDEENALVEEISSKLTPIANRADELQSLQNQKEKAAHNNDNSDSMSSSTTDNTTSPSPVISDLDLLSPVISHLDLPTPTDQSPALHPSMGVTNLIESFPSAPHVDTSAYSNPPYRQPSNNTNTNDSSTTVNNTNEANIYQNNIDYDATACTANGNANASNANPGDYASDSVLSLVLNIEKVICWQIHPVTKERKMIADGKYPLKVFIRANPPELVLSVYPQTRVEVNASVACLELTPCHYIFSLEENTQMVAIVFESNMPEIYTKIFENYIIAFCAFRKHVPEVQTVTLATSEVTVEEPEDEESTTVASSTTQETFVEVSQALVPLGVGTAEMVPFVEQKQIITKENLDAVAARVETGGKMVVHAVLTGGQLLQEGIEYCGRKIRDNVDVGHVEVPEVVKNTFAFASECTPVVQALSGVVVNTASGVASKFGTFVTNAAYVATTTAIASNSSGESDKPSDKPSEPSLLQQFLSDPRTKGVINIASKSATAAIDVWDALEEAGGEILDKTGDETAKVVEKRFGPDMATIVSNSVVITTDLVKTTRNINYLGPKALLKSQTKVAAKASATALFDSPLLKQPSSASDENEPLLIEPSSPNFTEGEANALLARAQFSPQQGDNVAEDELLMFSELETTTESLEGFVLIEPEREQLKEQRESKEKK